MDASIKQPQNRFIRFFKSKFIVGMSLVLLTLGMFFGIKNANANDDGTDISTVYQYFLLYNKRTVVSDASDNLVKKGIQGVVGSGGNIVTFGYSDIVNDSNNEKDAKTFVSAMSTLSFYNYLSTQTQGLARLMPMIGRFFLGIFLLVGGVIVDTSTFIYQALLDALSKFNVTSLLAEYFVSSKIGSDLLKMLDITADTLRTFITMLLTIFSLAILVTIICIFAKSSNGHGLDKNDSRNLLSRFIALITVPVAFILGASLLSEITSLSAEYKADASYSKYLLDVKSWAYGENFSLTDAGAGDISGKASTNYVDTDFNPYVLGNALTKDNGVAYKIATISDRFHKNSESSSASNTYSSFRNSSLALDFMTSQSFNARDYLGFKTSEQSSGFTGSIYDAVKNIGEKKLIDFDNKYTSTGNEKKSWTDDLPIADVKDDYVDDTQDFWHDSDAHATASLPTIWKDRYIYGAKNSGDIDKYYKKEPSWEQIYSGLGSGNGFQLSDASMFYVLSTQFDESGGTFFLDGPAKGAYKTISTFDSQRPSYYSTSMVGSWIFTAPALLSMVLIRATVLIAVILAFLEIGFLDMNIKPFRTFVKGIAKGGLGYTLASLMYVLGIVATIMWFTVFPDLFIRLIEGMSSGVTTIATGNLGKTGNGTTSMIAGVSTWMTALVSFGFAYGYFKLPSFRNKVTNVLMMPWQFFNDKGQTLEDNEDGNAKGTLAKTMNASEEKRAQRMSRVEGMAKKGAEFATGVTKDKYGRSTQVGTMGQKLGKAMAKYGVRTGAFTPVGADEKASAKENSMQYIESLGKAQRMQNAFNDVDDETLDKAIRQQGTSLSDDNLFTKAKDEDGNIITDADGKAVDTDRFATDVKGLSSADREVRDNFNQEADDLAMSERALGQALTPEERQQLETRADGLKAQQARLAENGQDLSDVQKAELQDIERQLARDDNAHQGLSDAERNKYQQQYDALSKKQASGLELTNDEKETLQKAKTILANDSALKAKQDAEHQLASITKPHLTESQKAQLRDRIQGMKEEGLSDKQVKELRDINDKLADTSNMSPEEVQKLQARKQELENLGKSETQLGAIQDAETELKEGDLQGQLDDVNAEIGEIERTPARLRSNEENAKLAELNETARGLQGRINLDENAEALNTQKAELGNLSDRRVTTAQQVQTDNGKLKNRNAEIKRELSNLGTSPENIALGNELKREFNGNNQRMRENVAKVHGLDDQIKRTEANIARTKANIEGNRKIVSQVATNKQQALDKATEKVNVANGNIAQQRSDMNERRDAYVKNVQVRRDNQPDAQKRKEMVNTIQNNIKQFQADVNSFQQKQTLEGAETLKRNLDSMEKTAEQLGARVEYDKNTGSKVVHVEDVYGKGLNANQMAQMKRDMQDTIDKMPANQRNQRRTYGGSGDFDGSSNFSRERGIRNTKFDDADAPKPEDLRNRNNRF